MVVRQCVHIVKQNSTDAQETIWLCTANDKVGTTFFLFQFDDYVKYPYQFRSDPILCLFSSCPSFVKFLLCSIVINCGNYS